MLTRQGWVATVASIGLVGAGRLFGIFELFVVGAGGAALVVGALVLVGSARLRLDVARELHPPRVHAGGRTRVELRVVNRGRRRTPLLALRDPVGDGHSARVLLAPLAPGGTARASYRLPTPRRGLLTVGPLRVEVSDPFGLAAVTTPGAPVAQLTVWPAVDAVPPLPHTQGDDPYAGADHRNVLVTGGQDFYALRHYVVGDDLRRVHWRATARHDELMVRQDEMPWQGRATILLDTRRAAHTTDSFERAVSAAASLVLACADRRFLIRLVTTAGDDAGYANGTAHVEAMMEHLAAVQATERGDLGAVVASLGRTGGGALAALVGARSPRDLAALSALGRSFRHVSVIGFASAPTEPTRSFPGIPLVDGRTTFQEAWAAALRQRRSALTAPPAARSAPRRAARP